MSDDRPSTPGRTAGSDDRPDSAPALSAEARIRALSEQVRRLTLDNEDLRFDCARLKATIAQNQIDAAALARRNGMLQRHVDVLHRFTAWRHTRLFRFIMRRLL